MSAAVRAALADRIDTPQAQVALVLAVHIDAGARGQALVALTRALREALGPYWTGIPALASIT